MASHAAGLGIRLNQRLQGSPSAPFSISSSRAILSSVIPNQAGDQVSVQVGTTLAA
jgi:hypothetical protein